MTDKKTQKKQDRRKPDQQFPRTPRFHLVNWIILAFAIILIGLGFLLLWNGSITLAPIMLVMGYCVIIPVALLLRIKGKAPDAQAK
jgi:fatty acid desaturase